MLNFKRYNRYNPILGLIIINTCSLFICFSCLSMKSNVRITSDVLRINRSLAFIVHFALRFHCSLKVFLPFKWDLRTTIFSKATITIIYWWCRVWITTVVYKMFYIFSFLQLSLLNSTKYTYFHICLWIVIIFW